MKILFLYRQSSAYTVLSQFGFLNNTFFCALICPFSTKSLFCLHGCFSKVLKDSKQRTPCTKVFQQKIIIFLPQFFLGQDLHFSFGTHVSRGSNLQRGTTSLWHSCRGVCEQILRGSSWHVLTYLTVMVGTSPFIPEILFKKSIRKTVQ